MKDRVLIALIALMLILSIMLVGCKKRDEEPEPDVITTASIVDTPEAFINAVGPDAHWLAGITKDLRINQDVVVEGDYNIPDKDDASKLVPAGRKIALYSQDADRNKTASYTLTIPKLYIRSKDTKIQGGTFVGDVYVEESGFNLVDAKIDGNVYFATEDLEASFKMDNESSVTGVTEVK